MSLQRMPNGEYVNIAPGTPPAVVARIRAQYAPARSAPAAAAPATPAETRDAALARRVASASRPFENIPVLGSMDRAANSFVHEATLHASDVLAPAAIAGVRALRGGNFGNEYRAEQEALRSQRNTERERSPLATGAGGILGMIAAPIPGFGRGVAAGAGAARTGGSRLLDAAARATRGPVGNAAAVGAAQSGLTTLIDTNGDVGQAAQSAAFGGLTGGAAGFVLGKALPGVARAFTDRTPANAERVAYDKIAAMLSRSRDEAGAAFSPASATAEIADATARGTPTSLGDLSAEMQNMRGELARRTALPSAGDAAAQAELRLASAADRFEVAVKRTARTANSGTNAVQARANITAERKAQAATDYARGGALDRPLAPTPQLIRAISPTTATPDMRIALQAARRAFANDPEMGAFTATVRQNGRSVQVPTTRAFDEIKKSFDDLIENGIKYLPDGSTVVSNASRSASKQLRALKDQVAASNPEYAALVGRQRDAFERLDGLNVGKNFISQMGRNSRELLTNLTTKGARNADEVRTGVIDALLAMRNTSKSPIKMLRSWERNPDQRAVLVHIMGGQRQFNRFAQFMRRELRAMQADEVVLRTSRRPVLNEFSEHAENTPIQRGLGEVMRGQAYGGVTGAASAGMRAIDRLQHGMGPEAQDVALRLLGGGGEGLEAGVASARAVREARRLAALERARAGGKLAGSGTAAIIGTGE